MTSGLVFPPIDSVPKDFYRPFWSVMIPTYNGTKYLEQTLKSILIQDPGLEKMQIEVVDDCSTSDDPERLVQEIGQGRISFYRNPQNMGLVGNWNSCIQRARGHWVHILHQDDIVLPGFYTHLEEGIQTDLSVGSAFCRYLYMNQNGHWQFLSSLERETPGILENWIEKIAITQRIQYPAMVVKRSTYEKLGGFCAEVHYSADWEMWKRVAVYCPVWYEPQVLACYRLHPESESSRLSQSGADIADIRRAIKMSEAYLPKDTVKILSLRAREHYALYALTKAYNLIAQHNFIAAKAQVREALYCSYSFRVIKSIVGVLNAAIIQVVFLKKQNNIL